MKVGIVIITFNLDCRIFILQIEAIKKFCRDNYVIEVIDNSTNPELAAAIKHHAFVQGVNYKKTMPSTTDASQSHSFAANHSYRILKNHYDYFFYLDHDCIPVKEFSVVKILGDKIMGGMLHGQAETKYFWPGCVMWKNFAIDNNLIDFKPDHKLRIDTGGGFYKVIEAYGLDRCVQFDEVGCENPYFTDSFYNFYMMICEGRFMHFINSSNWNPTDRNENRLNHLMNICLSKIQENDNLPDK